MSSCSRSLWSFIVAVSGEGQFIKQFPCLCLFYTKLFSLKNIVSLYAGISVGAISLEVDTLDERGIIYGFQVGALIYLSENLSLEVTGLTI
jgi:hypothetical protein